MTGIADIDYYLDRDLYQEIEVYNDTIDSNNKTIRTAWDYTGYTAKMQVRRRSQSKDAKVYFTLSTSDYSIVLTSGLITLSLDKSLIEITEGVYFYDIVLTNLMGIETQHIQGRFNVNLTVTNI